MGEKVYTSATDRIYQNVIATVILYLYDCDVIAWNYYDITADEGDAPGDITADPGERSETDTEITVRDDEHHCRV